MQKFDVNEGTLFVSEETLAEYQTHARKLNISAKKVVNRAIKRLYRERLSRELAWFLDAWAAKHGGVVMLDAHGSRQNDV